MLDTPSPVVSIPHKIIMEFYGAVFQLYPNITRIQDIIHEDTQSFTCTFSISDILSLSEQEARQSAIFELMQKKILPALPEGYQITLQDIILKMPEQHDDIILKDLCDMLKKEFPDIAEIQCSIIGDEVAFSIAGGISPQVKHVIRQVLIAEFPLWNTYQPRDPVFYHQETLNSTPESTRNSFGSWVRSILQGG